MALLDFGVNSSETVTASGTETGQQTTRPGFNIRPVNSAPVQIPQNVQSAIDNTFEELTQDQNELKVDDKLLDAETRLEKAMCYRQLLNHNFFSTGSSEVAWIVQEEIKDFVHERFQVLLGLMPDTKVQQVVKSPFSLEEETALKAWAAKLLSKPGLISVPAAPKTEPMTPVLTPPITSTVNTPSINQAPVQQSMVRRGRGRPRKEETQASIRELPQVQKDLPPGVILDEHGRPVIEREYTMPDGSKKVIQHSVATQTTTPAQLPMPTGTAFEHITASKATEGMTPDMQALAQLIISKG